MKDFGTNDFQADEKETISINVTVDKKPFLCEFSDPPTGSVWKNISHAPGSLTASRNFTMPVNSGAQVAFDMDFDTQIAATDDVKKATYTVQFSGSAGGSATRTIVVTDKTGSVSRVYTFSN